MTIEDCDAKHTYAVKLTDEGRKVAEKRVAETLAEQLIEPFAPDLVVCGERGLSNIKYVFVGSVSTYLIRNLRCDVLVVKQAGA